MLSCQVFSSFHRLSDREFRKGENRKMADNDRTEMLKTQAVPGMNMPFSPEAEQSVLGAILLDSSCMDQVTEILPKPE